MKRFRRLLKTAWIAQLALLLLALPAAHVHRHAPGGCGRGACEVGTPHAHAGACSAHGHGHVEATGSIDVSARVAGERSIESATGGVHDDCGCVACDVQRLIGQGFMPAESLALDSTPTLSAFRLIATVRGRSLEALCCRGPPIAC